MVGLAMHVVAHEDDDLLFMNPDLDAAVEAGTPIVTVYVSAGQISGNGETPGARARSRQAGVQAAYAEMAGVAGTAEWESDALFVARRKVERYRLVGSKPIELIFVNLPDGGLHPIAAGGAGQTVIVDDGPVTRSYTYRLADVIAVLSGLMARYQPTVLRTQDSLPDARYDAEHADHLAAARFAEAAADAYSDELLVVSYRCYNISSGAMNLDTATRADKRKTMDAYLPFDELADPDGWPDRMFHRWPSGSGWLGHNADGRPQVFLVRGGTAVTWWQRPDGGWGGPQPLDGAGGPLARGIAVGNNADGRMEIFARRLTDHQIVTTFQVQVNGAWRTGWVSLGNPNAGGGRTDQVGAPTVANNADGRMQIFVKNGGGGVSTTFQTAANGTWGNWVDLLGTDVQDGLAAVVDAAGRIELFGSTRQTILHWHQTAPNAGITLNNAFPALRPASPPAAVLAQDGTITLAYRAADTGEVAINTQTSAGGAWTGPTALGGTTGFGQLALVAPAGPDSRVFLIGRRTNGEVDVAIRDHAGTSWLPLDGRPVLDSPTAGLDPTGAVLIFTVGVDGVLRLSRRPAPGSGQTFSAWQPLP